MKKQEFLIPGLALTLAALLGVYLVINAGRTDVAAPADGTELTATSTVATSTTDTDNEGSALSPRRGHYLYGPVTISLNQAAGFANDLSIRPLDVTEDSRCPQDAQCISAGTVRVSVRVRTDTGTPSEATQVLSFALNEPRVVDSTTITLTSVTPVPLAGQEIPAAQYRLTFEVRQTTSSVNPTPPCYVGGCSAQLCTDRPDAVSTCEYRAEYGCYKNARCQRQASGQCGWTQTDALKACLANPS